MDISVGNNYFGMRYRSSFNIQRCDITQTPKKIVVINDRFHQTAAKACQADNYYHQIEDVESS
jgi:hypothetical protein